MTDEPLVLNKNTVPVCSLCGWEAIQDVHYFLIVGAVMLVCSECWEKEKEYD
jgi:hypothetical protein